MEKHSIQERNHPCHQLHRDIAYHTTQSLSIKVHPFAQSHGYIIDEVVAEAASQVCSIPETTVETSTIEQRTGRGLTQCGRDSDLAAEPR